jgi:hypothetical protein
MLSPGDLVNWTALRRGGRAAGRQNAGRCSMRERYYGLLREYLVTLRERDLCEKLVHAAPEGVEREEARRKLELSQKRSKALRREIKRYPDINTPPHPPALNSSPSQRYQAQAR